MDVILGPVIEVLNYAIEIYIYLIIAMAILSWLVSFQVINTRNPIVNRIGEFLYRITEPALRPIRRIVPSLGGIDISPVILILALILLQRILVRVYVSLAM
ncbi:YggT family protein [Limibacillus halophilus]|jgi:YggT family protein